MNVLLFIGLIRTYHDKTQSEIKMDRIYCISKQFGIHFAERHRIIEFYAFLLWAMLFRKTDAEKKQAKWKIFGKNDFQFIFFASRLCT